jgi:hypothetical protein
LRVEASGVLEPDGDTEDDGEIGLEIGWDSNGRVRFIPPL